MGRFQPLKLPALAALSRRLFAGTALVTVLAVISPAAAQNLGFSVSVDGEHVAGDVLPESDPARSTDVELERTDIQIKFDGLDVKPMLNALPVTMRRAYGAGEKVEFLLTTNYPSWIERSEIRIFLASDDLAGAPATVIPTTTNGTASWTMPTDGNPDYIYVARVYDAAGRFDETAPLTLRRTMRNDEQVADPDLVAAGWGEDRTYSRTIPVFGGAVTVFGSDVPEGASVVALGESIPVDASGLFVVQRILPPGDHVVDVAVGERAGATMQFDREINIPTDEWFYVAMADLTVGKRFGNGEMIAADPSEFGDVYTKGHLAFYLKGKIKGEYLLTASADTGEGPLDDLLTGMLSKDPHAILRRIDPNEYYPVYGDDSTLVDDAPTRGKLYVRLERGPSHVMWGNFRTQVGDSAFLNTDRALYGASAVYRSDGTTTAGEHQVSASVYAAQPGTLGERDVLRGTGGSAYFLRHQDIVAGSETISIEVRDPLSGAVKSSRTLRLGTDYRINYIQGLVILTTPLLSTAAASGAVQSGDGGDHVNLVAQYEYTPTGTALDDMAFGGRAQAWLNDNVAIGATAIKERNDLSDSEFLAADMRLQASETTFIEAELAHSRGSSSSAWASTDGGLTFVQQLPTGSSGAYAVRLNAQVDLADVSDGSVKGTLGATFEGREAGFSTADRQVQADEMLWSTFAAIEANDQTMVNLDYDHFEDSTGTRRDRATAELLYEIDPYWEIAFGVHYVDLAHPTDPTLNGERADAGVRLTYKASDDLKLYGFGQATLWRADMLERNDRVGIGTEWQISEILAVGGEVSYGSNGFGALASLSYEPTADERNYIAYRLNPDYKGDYFTPTANQQSGLVVGTERRYSDIVSVHAENNYSLFTERQTLTSSYGVTLTPDTLWTIDGALEVGEIVDLDASWFKRYAASFGLAYKDDGIEASARGEVRLENSEDGTRNRQTYLMQGGLSWETSADWRLLANFDGVISNSDQSAVLNGDYVEASLGYAYRPVDNERLNMLFRYTYLYDLPGPDQVNGAGRLLGPAQRSSIFSVDANYDINEYITLGAKYGFRIGEVSLDRDPLSFTRSSAHLGILRADIAVLQDWDILLEGRVMYLPEAVTTDLGALAAVYRDMGDNLRLGVGYNFSQFSDDLADLTYDDQGVFFNVLAKY